MAKNKNVIAPNDNDRAVEAMDRQDKAIEKATELYGDGEPFEVERILDCMEYRSMQITKNLESFGRYCLWLKEGIGWGGFSQALERRGFDKRGAYQAMLQVEKFGDNCATVAQLGSRKARTMTFFTKEEIEKYVEGGDLRGISHDDVESMTTNELEAEVRKLRQKFDREKKQHKKETEEKAAEIEQLQSIIDRGIPLTEKEKQEKAAAVKLEELRKKLFSEIQQARFHFGEAVMTVETAQKVEGANFAMLESWAKEEYAELAGFNEIFEDLDEALNYCRPDKGDGEHS